MENVIDIEGLRVLRGGQPVLKGISLHVEKGSVTGLLGPSGCGKTTLIRSIVGVQRCAAGRVRVLGQPAGAASLRRQVGYVTQAPSIYQDLSVEENLRYFANLVGAPNGRVVEMIETVGLTGHRSQVARSLSSGEKARVSLAIALLHSPPLLVLDEPTVGLDPLLRVELWRTFRQLAGEGVTLLVSSHVMDEAAECDVLLLMREGTLLAQIAPQALRQQTSQDDLGRAFVVMIERSVGKSR
jgi:ABC-2 type transport system ATP-binding protein